MLNLLFPKVCNGCKNPLNSTEKVLCVHCRHQLPLACHHRHGSSEMMNLFYGRCAIFQATALLYFHKKGITQELLHNLKYRGQHEISGFFGHWMGSELAEIQEYRDIDLVIPVPLHPSKRRKRGYNQVTGFGKAIAEHLQCTFQEDLLLKISKSKSQVFKSRFGRFSKDEMFSLSPVADFSGQHILLVDDIVTTGATLEQCAHLIQQQPGVKLSLATIAIAS